ncbi:hypothetical protein M407DRAFT_243351 [Tulasnella calospora MUT 4182]|uniref:Uncharacterized protein n=1 Tax=Tulasnella calospora MUT 4182 TaxID=1051891 RepID=A0A0C3QLD4_9AGAM|nr:hypothetical protein M407DRAFT_243351 [Tulasnella calospora MUT 4182]
MIRTSELLSLARLEHTKAQNFAEHLILLITQPTGTRKYRQRKHTRAFHTQISNNGYG